MEKQSETHLKEKNISLRIDQDSLDLISTAAKMKGLSRSAYLIESTRKHAEKLLLEQTLFTLDDDQWNEFNDMLNEKHPDKRLKKLLQTPAPWNEEKGC